MKRRPVNTEPVECVLGMWDEIVGTYRGLVIQPDRSASVFVSTHGLMRYLRCVIADPLYNAVLYTTRELETKGLYPIGATIQILRTPLDNKPWCVYIETPTRRPRRKRRKRDTVRSSVRWVIPPFEECKLDIDALGLRGQRDSTGRSPHDGHRPEAPSRAPSASRSGPNGS